jgi:hypothetical protein
MEQAGRRMGDGQTDRGGRGGLHRKTRCGGVDISLKRSNDRLCHTVAG